MILIMSLFFISSLTSCNDNPKKDDFSVNLDEFERYVALDGVQPESVKWKMIKLSARKSELKPYRICALLQFKEIDTNLLAVIEEKEDISKRVYLEETTIKYPFLKDVGDNFYKEDNFYKINKPVYSVEYLVKDPFLTGYFFICGKNQIFIAVQAE